MRRRILIAFALAAATTPALLAQAAARPIELIMEERRAEQQQREQQQQPQARPQPAQPAQPAPAAAPAAPAATMPVQPPRMADQGLLSMDNVNLVEMVNLIAKMLKLNIMVDPRVKGSVTIHTYGEVKPVELMPLLEVILRVNGSAIVKVGDLYRVVPLSVVSQLPLSPMINADVKTLPDDEQTILDLIFLKYATATDMDKLLAPFYGENATHSVYEPANLLILQDNARNLRRTMELIGLFDSDTFATKRVRLFEIENSRPSDLAKELETVFKAYSLSGEKGAGGSVRFIPVDRINTLIAVAPNPGIFKQVEDWIDKLDIPVKVTAGSTSNWVYRLKYGRAETMAMAIMALYSGNPMALIGMAQQANSSMYSMGLGLNGTGANSGYGMGGGGGSGYGGGYGGMNGGYGNSYGGMSGNMYGGYGGMSGGYNGYQMQGATAQQGTASNPIGATAAGDRTGSYLGQGAGGGAEKANMPHVIPNPFDNTILVQGTPQDWEQIQNLLHQLDVAPRQVLIECKIYEVDLSSSFGLGVSSTLANIGANTSTVFGTSTSTTSSTTTTTSPTASQALIAATNGTALGITAGMIVGKSRQLLGVLSANESNGWTKVISSPSIIATDSIPAVMNVGSQVPVATSTALATTGSSQTFQSIGSQSTGVTLDIMARINSSGIVTMVVNQQVSAPTGTAGSLDQSFSNRSLSTQVTVQDGDTIAIGGAISESKINSTAGVPYLSRIPIVGALFGSKSSSVSRSELIMFLTPHVIYDTNQMLDATEEIKTNLKRVAKMMRSDNQ
jgi:general secretion pathway protein D